MSFDGQRVVIIGASAGIGEAAAKTFAAGGRDSDHHGAVQGTP